jgi:hypothetical protein
MTIYQVITMLFAASLPFVVLVVVGRHVVSAFRSLRDRRFKFALFSILAIAGILLLSAGVAVVWFGYGVGHTKKDIWSDLILLTVSAVPIYGGGYGLWRAARYMDEKPGGVEA